LAAAFLTVVILHEAIGVVLFAPAAVAYLLAAGLGRAIIARARLAAPVDWAIGAASWGNCPMPGRS